MYSIYIKTIKSLFCIALLFYIIPPYLLANSFENETEEFYKLIENGKTNMYLPLNKKDLLSIYNVLFNSTAIQIDFHMIEKGNADTENLISKGTLWFSEGNMFIKKDLIIREYKDYQENEYNYATIDNKVYEWEESSKKGNILKREKYDTMKYLLYFIDIAAIKMSIYSNYLNNQNKFKVVQNGETKTILYNQPPDPSIIGISIFEKPLWINAIICKENDKTIILEIDKPKIINAIPSELLSLPGDIEWTEVDYSLETYLRYL
jgi:hypothetical protein